MSEYYPKLRLKEGDIISFDGEMWFLSECVQPNGDTYTVAIWENGRPCGVEEKHIDEFADKFARSDRVVIERRNEDARM